MNRKQRRALGVKKAIKVAIGIPSLDMVPVKFALSLAAMLSYTAFNQPEIQTMLINKAAQPTDKSRREIVEIAKSLEADYLLFLDSDMIFPEETLVTLMKEMKNWALVGCNYARRDKRLESTAIDLDGKRLNPKLDHLKEVKGIGLGVTVMDMRLFNYIEKPYFLFTHDPEGVDLSEDFYFCNKVRKAAMRVMCHGPLSRKLSHSGYEEFKLP